MIASAVNLALALAFIHYSASSAGVEELPPLPATLMTAAGAVCINVSKEGEVSGAYVLASTGDPQADQDMLAWVHQLRWPIATLDEKLRDTWFPMPIAFGNKPPPQISESCRAPSNSTVR